VFVSNKNRREYPEVTGYLIPTLLEWGEHDLAKQYALWLCTVQNDDGSWNDPYGTPYTFDTGQAVKGLRAMLPRIPDLQIPISRGEMYIRNNIDPSGRLATWNESCWSGEMTDAIQVYATHDSDVWDYHLHQSKKPALSHFAMYVAEALVDAGFPQLEHEYWPMHDTGMVPGVQKEGWSCLPGQFQYALVQFKLGNFDKGTAALKYGLRFQNASGGFYGCTDSGWYFPDEEPSWTVKFFLDAYRWWMKTQFHPHAMRSISPTDGRLIALRDAMPPSCGSVLDCGCGAGRYLHTIDAHERVGIDVSPILVQHTPNAVEGSLLNIPFPDNRFDCTYAVESLEHSIRPDVAIAEMCRVTKPGGTVIVIDKNAEHLGAMQMAPWEQWFHVERLSGYMGKWCSGVTWRFCGYENTKPDGLFVLWQGVKR
jgi:malonyl-CoA O-methyltransferase